MASAVLAMSLGRNDSYTNQNKREVSRGCLTNTQRKRKGETGPICLVLNAARRGAFYSRLNTYDKHSTE